MSSVYHILNQVPAIDKVSIQSEYEHLVQELIRSGRLRIDTDYYCNFVRFTDSNSAINIILSYEELTPELLGNTKNNIRNLYKNSNKLIDDTKIISIINDLNKKAKKLLLVNDELKTQLARVFVQSAHPIVIKWLLLDNVEVFITYSHNIGDVMDIASWKRSGTNSGMQSTDGKNACIYVSCGGDPFALNSESHPTQGNGWAALARLQIIAAQELGHFADIKRDDYGRQITRHSCNFACTKATPHVSLARKKDIERSSSLKDLLINSGMDKLINIETKLKFYNQQKLSGLRVFWLRLIAKYYSYKLVNFAIKRNFLFVKRFYDREKYVGLMLAAMIEDMLSNLSPIADVYKRDNPEAEEAISCAEALARVPQQVMKWGHLTTRATMHDLYHVYYSEVIPSLIKSYNTVTASEYKRNYSHQKNTFRNILFKLGFIQNKTSVQFTEVRDI
ncbi:MAG: DUF2748 family protein [Rickettsiaceae bacterium]|nr:DUF2748 family protein [Rickettsiaceae bacterium]